MAHADMSTVGVIINPHAGKDIRRLVSAAGQTSDAVKIGIVRRVVVGALEQGAERVLLSSDTHQLAERAVEGIDGPIEFVESPLTGSHLDTIAAARSMWKEQAGAIVALGGDGTCRDVATGWPDAPLIAISTGTNNVFPTTVDGTTAGVAAALVATGAIDIADVSHPAKRVALRIDDPARNTVHHDTALVEAALIETAFVGARAVNDPSAIRWVVAAIAEPASTGVAQHRRTRASDRSTSRRRRADPSSALAAGESECHWLPAPSPPSTCSRSGPSRSVNLSRCPVAECWPTTANARPRSARMQRSRCRSKSPAPG